MLQPDGTILEGFFQMNVFTGAEEQPDNMMINEEIAEDEEGGGESEYTSEENIISEDIQGERSAKKLVHKTPTKLSEGRLSGSKKSLYQSEMKQQRTQDSIPELL
jgi:hypothetical protein